MTLERDCVATEHAHDAARDRRTATPDTHSSSRKLNSPARFPMDTLYVLCRSVDRRHPQDVDSEHAREAVAQKTTYFQAEAKQNPLVKEILAGGITVLSTDFNKMGETLADMIKNRTRGRIKNPFKLIIRNSI